MNNEEIHARTAYICFPKITYGFQDFAIQQLSQNNVNRVSVKFIHKTANSNKQHRPFTYLFLNECAPTIYGKYYTIQVHSFPFNSDCGCNTVGIKSCDGHRRCQCKTEYTGEICSECNFGHHKYGDQCVGKYKLCILFLLQFLTYLASKIQMKMNSNLNIVVGQLPVNSCFNIVILPYVSILLFFLITKTSKNGTILLFSTSYLNCVFI